MHAARGGGEKGALSPVPVCLVLVQSPVSDADPGRDGPRLGEETTMRIQRVATVALVAASGGLLLAAGSAQAQRAARPPAQVTVTNARSVPLTAFEIATTGEQPRLVAKLAKPLAPGKSIALRLNRPAGCSYYVLAKFGDEVESDSEGMDLCADKVIRLTE
jgi:hypothetical protein